MVKPAKIADSADIAARSELRTISACADIPDIRCGHGYDIHSFIEARKVPGEQDCFIMLCGVKIPFSKKLNGHSDSDVVLHALTDALLATIGLGDIGTHFPPHDQQWKNKDSRFFVEFAWHQLQKYRAHINNIDITIIAEAPKILPYREEMKDALIAIFALERHRISIKATTQEKLGAIGQGLGIAALATVSVFFPKQA